MTACDSLIYFGDLRQVIVPAVIAIASVDLHLGVGRARRAERRVRSNDLDRGLHLSLIASGVSRRAWLGPPQRAIRAAARASAAACSVRRRIGGGREQVLLLAAAPPLPGELGCVDENETCAGLRAEGGQSGCRRRPDQRRSSRERVDPVLFVRQDAVHGQGFGLRAGASAKPQTRDGACGARGDRRSHSSPQTSGAIDSSQTGSILDPMARSQSAAPRGFWRPTD